MGRIGKEATGISVRLDSLDRAIATCFCHLRTAVVSLSHAGHWTENHDVVQFLRDGQEGRIPVRGQDRVPISPRDGVGHVFPLPSPPLREDADGLHVGGGLPRQEEVVQRAPIDKTDYDWKKYPVIHIDFTNCWKKKVDRLAFWLKKVLLQTAISYGIAPLD